MKKVFLLLALVASLQVTSLQAQPKNSAAARAAVEKAELATKNPKQSAKFATWMKYGQTLIEAHDAPVASLWRGMSQQEMAVIAGNEKPMSEETVEVGGAQMLVQHFAEKNLYFNAAGQLDIMEITKPAVPNALESALAAYVKAAELDVKGAKTADIKTAIASIAAKYSDDAYYVYALGNPADASVLFEQAFVAAGTAPNSQIDTNSIYNAGFTAWQAGNIDRAKTLFAKSLECGYAGGEGDVYAKLADIASKQGNETESKDYLEAGFKAFPQSQVILVGLINYYLTSGDDTARLFDLLAEAKKNEPNNASLYYVEGNIRVKLGEGDAAVAAYRQCAQINPDYEYGYIGEGLYYYNLAVEIQDKAQAEMDDAKYTALMGEFEAALKNCIAPFETAYNLTKDPEVKQSVAEYLKNACYRFSDQEEYQAKYKIYSEAVGK